MGSYHLKENGEVIMTKGESGNKTVNYIFLIDPMILKFSDADGTKSESTAVRMVDDDQLVLSGTKPSGDRFEMFLVTASK